MCAQYMKAIVRDVRPEALEEAGVQLIVIGNGSAKMIDGYACRLQVVEYCPGLWLVMGVSQR